MTETLDFTRFAINANLDDKTFKEEVYNKRLELIQLAIAWEGTTPQNHFIIHNVWKYPADPSYIVCFGKFGKEYYENGKNCNDMKPCVFKDNAIVDSFRGRFDDIFALLEDCGKRGMTDVVKAFSILFFRNALLLDHNNNGGTYNYCPPQELVDYICTHYPTYEGIPMEVYLHTLDAIGFNEDVKYYTQEKLQKKTGIGRENNMKTYCYASACVLGAENWAGFIYKLMRGYGVAPITNQMFSNFCSEANVTYNTPRIRTRRVNSETISVERFVDHY